MTDGCAWCGAPLEDAIERRGRLDCRRCGTATTHPWPSEDELDAAYGEWYRPSSGRFGKTGDALLRRSRASLASRVDSLAPPGEVVDVGAGEGVLVAAIEQRGRRAIGLERGGVQLEDLEEPVAGFVLWHSLEHLRAPRAAIRDAARLLVPGGVVLIAVPNYASLQARVFGDGWLALDLPRHLSHLPASALIDGLVEDGFVVERVSYWRGGQVLFGWVHGLVGLLGLDLYQAIRSADARMRPLSGPQRLAALAAGVVLAPFAVVASCFEIALRRGGTVYVEARRG